MSPNRIEEITKNVDALERQLLMSVMPDQATNGDYLNPTDNPFDSVDRYRGRIALAQSIIVADEITNLANALDMIGDSVERRVTGLQGK